MFFANAISMAYYALGTEDHYLGQQLSLLWKPLTQKSYSGSHEQRTNRQEKK
jgi:hypothetical protein